MRTGAWGGFESHRSLRFPGQANGGGNHVGRGGVGRAVHDPSQDVMGDWLRRLRLGRAQECGGIVLVPLLEPWPGASPRSTPGHAGSDSRRLGNGIKEAGTHYRPMPEAMARGELMVMEVSPEGMVSEVLVVNRSTAPVLALEGEEWSGARQNRVLTESVLVREIVDFVTAPSHRQFLTPG